MKKLKNGLINMVILLSLNSLKKITKYKKQINNKRRKFKIQNSYQLSKCPCFLHFFSFEFWNSLNMEIHVISFVIYYLNFGVFPYKVKPFFHGAMKSVSGSLNLI